MPFPVGANVEWQLESALLSVLQARTDAPLMRRQLQRFLAGSESSNRRFQWAFEGDAEPATPFAQLSKKSQSRFGNGMPVYRRDAVGRFLEEQWRITITLIKADESLRERDNSTLSLDVLFTQIVREQFKFPAGRAQLEALGIDDIRLTDEGENNEGNSFSFDCMTGVYFEIFEAS
jgi:hypothetical protein